MWLVIERVCRACGEHSINEFNNYTEAKQTFDKISQRESCMRGYTKLYLTEIVEDIFRPKTSSRDYRFNEETKLFEERVKPKVLFLVDGNNEYQPWKAGDIYNIEEHLRKYVVTKLGDEKDYNLDKTQEGITYKLL